MSPRGSTGTVLTFGVHFYELHGEDIKVTFGGDTYTLGRNEIFDLGCSLPGQRPYPRVTALHPSKPAYRSTHRLLACLWGIVGGDRGVGPSVRVMTS